MMGVTIINIEVLGQKKMKKGRLHGDDLIWVKLNRYMMFLSQTFPLIKRKFVEIIFKQE